LWSHAQGQSVQPTPKNPAKGIRFHDFDMNFPADTRSCAVIGFAFMLSALFEGAIELLAGAA